MATAYIVAATPSSPEPKRISNLKSAKAEADARAKLDRVDVEVRTVATSKLTYTAQGAPTAAPADEPVTAPQEAAEDTAPADTEPTEDNEGAPAESVIDMSGFEAALAEVVSGDKDAPAAEDGPAADAEEDGDEDAEGQDGEEDEDGPAADEREHRGQAGCGCSVEVIISSGEHQKGCADAPKEKEKVQEIERAKPARKPSARKGGGGRREAQGPSVVDGWELLYDKPKQKAQVGRNSDGKYALICTTHKHAHPLTRLVQERGLRGGSRSVWCPSCPK